MLDIKEVVTTVRLRRHFSLTRLNLHPMSVLIGKLSEGIGYLGTKPRMDLDEILTLNLKVLSEKRKMDLNAPDWLIESDLVLHSNLLQANIIDMIRIRKQQSPEIQLLSRRDIKTFADVLRNPRQNAALLIKLSDKKLTNAITKICRLYSNQPVPALLQDAEYKLRDHTGRWFEATAISSKNLRGLLYSKRLCNLKITHMGDDDKFAYFKKINKIVNVTNKSRMLRLLYGDVYCAERTFRFGLSENDKCKRCFSTETILHLLTECPYTRKVYLLLGITTYDINELLGLYLSKGEFEIRADFINSLVFRQRTLPPEVLVQCTLERYANGLTSRAGTAEAAQTRLISVARSL